MFILDKTGYNKADLKPIILNNIQRGEVFCFPEFSKALFLMMQNRCYVRLSDGITSEPIKKEDAKCPVTRIYGHFEITAKQEFV